MFKNGEMQTVVVDNFVPCDANGEPCFSKGNGPELWVIMLEKAWAKIHRSYERIIGGQSHLTFRDLTGAPSFEIESSEEGAFEKILEGELKDYAMSASCNAENEQQRQNLKELGLVPEHSYGLISASVVENKFG